MGGSGSSAAGNARENVSKPSVAEWRSSMQVESLESVKEPERNSSDPDRYNWEEKHNMK